MDVAGMAIEIPVGDPAGMRAKAARMGQECAALAAAAQQLDDRAAAMVYRGPAGDEFRRRVGERHNQLRAVLAAVQDLREEILREAGRLEIAQAAWRKALGGS